jgi:hypothetical protein
MATTLSFKKTTATKPEPEQACAAVSTDEHTCLDGPKGDGHKPWTGIHETAQVPATVPKAALPVAPARTPQALIASDDAIRMEDIVLPTLNIVQGVGDLCTSFDPGSLIFDKVLILAEAPDKGIGKEGPPIRMLVLGFRPVRYCEKVAGGDRGRLFNTEAQVAAAGGTTVYKEAYSDGEQIKDYYQALATAVVLIEAPDGAESEDMFPLEAMDNAGNLRRYALALWHLRGTGYTNAAKPLKTARALTYLRKGYASRIITVRTVLKPYGTNKAFIPVVRPPQMGDTEGSPSPALAALAKSVLDSLTGASAPAPADEADVEAEACDS